MANKFLTNVELDAGLVDGGNSTGTSGYVLSSTGTATSWIDQSTLASGSAERTEILVKNVHGSSLSKGDPVYIVGSVGASDRLEVALADAGNAAKMPCVGLLSQDLANNGQGTATVTGKIRNLITSPIDGATPTENDTIYVKSGGGLTLTKPTGSTNLIQNVGQVGRVSTSSDGNIVVSAILRSNDVPNLPTGKIWVGDGNTTVSDVVYLDEANGRMGINETNPGYTLDVNGSVGVEEYIYHKGDDDTYLRFTTDRFRAVVGSVNMLNITEDGSQNTFVVNESGVDVDFRVESDTNTHALFLEGSSGSVGIGTDSPGYKLDVAGDIRSTADLYINGGDIILGGTGRIQGVDTVSATTDAANKLYVDNAVAGVSYTHPTHPGDDINLDTGALTGATVISDLDFNITTDTLGHVTDANATYSTRNLTASDVGAAPSSHTHSASDITSGTLDTARLPEFIEERYIYNSNDSNGVFMPMVKGGMYATTASSVTGAIKVTLPSYKSSMMFTIYVDIYEYTTGETVTFRVSGYAYSDAGATWHNCSVVNLADNTDRNYTVRFYSDTTNNAQYFTIGETNSAWAYPQVNLRDFWGGYDTSESDALGEWNVEFVTSFTGDLRHTFTDNFVAADWDGIRDKPSTFTPSSHNHDDRYYTETESDSRFVNVTGDTMTGSLRLQADLNYFGLATVNNEAEIIVNTGEGGSPQIGFTDHGDASWAIGVDDGDNSFKIHGAANAVIPTINNLATPIFELTTSGLGYFGTQRIFADNYHPNADKWTTARTLSLTGDVTGSVSWDGSANASITATVADDSHNHTYLSERSTITFGASYLQWTDLSGQTGTGLNGSTPYNPTNDWYHHIIANHANSAGYYCDLAMNFHSNNHYITRVTAGTRTTVKLWNDGNDGSGSGLDADTLDGQHASAFAASSHTHTWANINGETANSVNGWGGLRHQTNDGYIDFGPANSSFAHIYTDRPSFYLNKDILVNGVVVLKGSGTTNYLSKFTGSTTLGNSLVYDNGTNVGIGTTSPGAKLSVAQPSSGDATILAGRRTGTPTIKSDSTEGGYLILDSHASAVALNHYSSNNVWLATGGGNVGIGTTAPTKKLEVAGSGIKLVNAANTHTHLLLDTATYDYKLGDISTTGGAYFQITSSTNQTYIYNSDLILSDGQQITITRSNPADPSCIYVDNTYTSFGTTYNIDSDVSSTFGSRHIGFRYNGTIVGFIGTNGTTAVTYSTSASDERLKKNIEDWQENILDKFEKIEPKKFNFISEKEGESKTKGFIAQNMAEDFPEAYPHDYSEDKYYSFNPSGMVVYLMKAVKDLVEQNKQLETRIQTLEQQKL